MSSDDTFNCQNEEAVKKAYKDAGYNPDDPADIIRANREAYNALPDDVKNAKDDKGKLLIDPLDFTSYRCPKCRCTIALHTWACYNPLGWFFDCRNHPGTPCTFQAETV